MTKEEKKTVHRLLDEMLDLGESYTQYNYFIPGEDTDMFGIPILIEKGLEIIVREYRRNANRTDNN